MRSRPFPLTLPWKLPLLFKQAGQLLYDALYPQRKQVLGLTVVLFSTIGLQILDPQIIGYFIDTAIAGGSQHLLWRAAGLYLAIALLIQAGTVVTTYLSERIAWQATNRLRLDLAHHCLHLTLPFHHQHPPGSLVDRVDGDVTLLARFFSQFVIHLIGNLLLLLGILVVLWFQHPLAGIILTLFSGGTLAFLCGLHRIALGPWGRYLQVSAEYFGFMGEVLQSREDLVANGASRYVMHRFYQILQRWLPLYQTARLSSTLLWASSVGSFTLGHGIALALAAYLWRQETLSLGSAYLIFHYTQLLSDPIERIREELEGIQQALASVQRVLDLRHTPLPRHAVDPVPIPVAPWSIEFSQVGFRYDTAEQPWALQEVSFQLPAGQVLGLLGQSGSGKSTLAALLLGLYQPQQGQITLEGIPLNHLSLPALRQQMGVVTQSVQLFQASLRDNLTFFNPVISDQHIMAALDHLHLVDWLLGLPQGLDTMLGANGEGISAGQAQMLAFTRILLKNPGLVILDEAASRLDPTAEQWMGQALKSLLQGRTGLIITHRPQTLQQADQILILQGGKVVEYGHRLTLLSHPQSQYGQRLRQDGQTGKSAGQF